MKVPRREIAAKSGVPYETINLWQHKRNKSSNNLPVVQKKDFHDISVENEIATVTVTDFKSQIILKTPKGYKISGLTQDSLLAVLKKTWAWALMLYDQKGLRVFVYKHTIDMRYGFERLHSFCVYEMSAQMDQGHLYMFFGRNRRRLKVLWFDGTGLTLAIKRIEKGSFMGLSELLGRTEISKEEFKLILHGSVIRHPVVEGEPVALPGGRSNNVNYGSQNSSPS